MLNEFITVLPQWRTNMLFTPSSITTDSRLNAVADVNTLSRMTEILICIKLATVLTIYKQVGLENHWNHVI